MPLKTVRKTQLTCDACGAAKEFIGNKPRELKDGWLRVVTSKDTTYNTNPLTDSLVCPTCAEKIRATLNIKKPVPGGKSCASQ